MCQASSTHQISALGENSLLEAIKCRDEPAAHLVLLQQQASGLDLDHQGPRGDGSALFWAACRGWLDLVGLLLALGADVTCRTIWGGTALHGAADNGWTTVAQLLLDQGASPHIKTEQGDTPCHLAAFVGHLNMVELLVKAGTDVKTRNKRGQTVSDVALSRGHTHISNWLLRRGEAENLLYQEVAGTTETDLVSRVPGRVRSGKYGKHSLKTQVMRILREETFGHRRSHSNPEVIRTDALLQPAVVLQASSDWPLPCCVLCSRPVSVSMQQSLR